MRRGRKKGTKFSEAHKKLLSQIKAGKPLSEEHKQALRKPKSVPSHRKGKKWLIIDGQRVWLTPSEYEDYVNKNPDARAWGDKRKKQSWRLIDGKRVWMTKEKALEYDNIYK